MPISLGPVKWVTAACPLAFNLQGNSPFYSVTPVAGSGEYFCPQSHYTLESVADVFTEKTPGKKLHSIQTPSLLWSLPASKFAFRPTLPWPSEHGEWRPAAIQGRSEVLVHLPFQTLLNLRKPTRRFPDDLCRVLGC